MALVLDATVGGATANSYITRAAADTYFEARFGAAAWTSASNSDKDKALVAATRHIDRHRFHGAKVYTDQALAFPRDEQLEPNDEIPAVVQAACCEEALAILASQATEGRSQRQQLQADGVRSFTVGDLSETYGASATAARLSGEAASLLDPWVDRTGRILSEGRESAATRTWYPFH